MSFDIFHESAYGSQPVALYTFTIGSEVIRHTSAETNITVGGNLYTPFAGIKHTDIRNSGENAKNKVTVTVTRTFSLATWLLSYVPTTEIFLTIHAYERGDTVDEELNHEFSGVYLRYISEFPEFKLEFAPLDYDSTKEVMKYSFGPICQHTQYDDYCGLSAATFQATGTVTAVSANSITTSITLNTPTATHYVGGYIEMTGVYGFERAWITEQSGANTVIIDRSLPAMEIGAAIAVIPSCRGKFSRCKDPALFNNKTRFFGAVNANKVNPFTPSGVNSSV